MANPLKNPEKKKLPKKTETDFKNSFFGNLVISIMIIFLVISIYSLLSGKKEVEKIGISELANSVKSGEIKELSVKNSSIEAVFLDDTIKTSTKESSVSLEETLLSYGVSEEGLSQIKVSVNQDGGFFYWVLNLSPILFPVLFIAVFIWLMTRQIKGAGMQAFSFGQSRARITTPDDQKQKVTFKDVAGCKEAKEELSEIVDFLKNPKKFFEIGARIPKGILLMGAPGTGKTLLARAVAGEAGVSFFSISGSEVVEMFVGIGASRVRDLFQLAKKAAPAIIFMDELDAVGRVRGGGLGGGNDEREQTLNQILVEMDGFDTNDAVIVMAATNRPDILDPALLRPGRFDRRVILDEPSMSDREAILKIHSLEKPLAKEVNLKVVAERTSGFSGADLANLVNEAAILAARKNQKEVRQIDIFQAIEKVILGPERRSHIFSKKEKEIIAYHEAGHALGAISLPHSGPVHKVSIVSRGRAGGYTLKLPSEDKHLRSKAEFESELAVLLGGYAAEKSIFKDTTTGATNDLKVASDLARKMVTQFGMSDKLGPITYGEKDELVFLGKEMGHTKNYSETVAFQIDSEVKKLVSSGLATAKKVLAQKIATLHKIAKELISKETLEQKEFYTLVS